MARKKSKSRSRSNSQAVAGLAARIADLIVPGQSKTPKDQVVFAFRCDLALRDQIHAAAAAANLSATAWIKQVATIAASAASKRR